MEYKAKGKEGTNAKGQKKENAKLGKVNKKRGNDGKRPGKEKKADDISNNFPNFSVLNQEEKLAFFEALSAARKNIEKRGLPTRERFGTVHDEYLQYFAQDDKVETVQKKPESAPSPRPSRKSPKESKLTTPESPKQRVPRTPEPVSPFKRTAKPPQKNLRPESEPNDFCESVIKRDTDQMIQMYLNKKKRIEEQWKKSSQANQSPPARPKNRERTRPPSGRAGGGKDPRAKTPSKTPSNTPQFQALNPPERNEFFRISKEAHANDLFKNPQQKDDILTLDEALKPYKGGGGKATTACPATQDLHYGKQQQKNLRVKVTLTSGDNKRLSRTKSQVLNDCAKEGSGGKSKSLESVVCADTPHGKQSKIPILRKAPQERNEYIDVKRETQPVKKIAREDLAAEDAPTAAEAKKTESPLKEKTLTIKEESETKEEIEFVAKGKKKDKRKAKKAEQVAEECEENTGDAAENIAQTKAELKKVRKEKEKALAEAAKREKELLRKKRKQEWRKRHQKKETQKKGASLDEDCSDLKVVGVPLLKEKCSEEDKKEHLEKKKCECENEELLTKKTILEKKDECEKEELMTKKTILEKIDECEENKSPRMQTKQEKEDECEEKEPSRMQTNQEKENESEEKISGEERYQKKDCVQKEQEEEEEEEEEEEDEEEDKESESEESSSSVEEECPCQQSSEFPAVAEECPCQQSSEFPAVAEECQQQPESSDSSGCGRLGPEHHTIFSSQTCNEHLVKAATQSTKSLAGMSLVEKRPEETWQAQEMAPTFTTGKVVVVDDNVIKRIKDLIHYLDKKVHPKDNLQSEYVRLVLSYTEYLTKVTESLIPPKKPKKGLQVHSTYPAREVRLKFDDNGDEALKEQKKGRIPHSISEDDFQRQTLPGPSGIEKKEDSRRKASGYDFDMLSDSESSSNSEEENRTLAPSAFKKTGIPMTKIRLLQDLLRGRAKFTEGSIDDFKIVHVPEAEYVPPQKPPKEEAKEISEADADQGQKTVGMKFLRNLAKLCNCGKKQIEEDAIMENLKGEAVRVDTAEPQKDPASVTINDSTMEVLKAAERKKIIEKYLKKEDS